MNYQQSHKGQVVERVVRNTIGVSGLSRCMGVSRKLLYKWFVNPDLDIKIIFSISVALEHDFSMEFPELLPKPGATLAPLREGELNVGAVQTNTADYWKNKYIALLEEQNNLITKEFPNFRMLVKENLA